MITIDLFSTENDAQIGVVFREMLDGRSIIVILRNRFRLRLIEPFILMDDDWE